MATLYRPVGPAELALIRDSEFAAFPPRLPEQPFFYPVVQRSYARRIAREWNATAHGAGYVTRFEVSYECSRRYERHDVGGRECTELWIPAAELPLFNACIEGTIEVVDAFAKSGWQVAYDLATDSETIRLVQKASLGPAGFGLLPEVALFGTAPWWAAIERGEIQRIVVDGTISKLYLTGHGDWPEIEIVSNGTKSSWTRLGNAELYAEGTHVQVEYVVQKLRRGLTEQKSVLRVLVASEASTE